MGCRRRPFEGARRIHRYKWMPNDLYLTNDELFRECGGISPVATSYVFPFLWIHLLTTSTAEPAATKSGPLG